ncbi:MAG: DUF421 domain-containing protein [Paenalcaligenes sp.]
MEWSFYAESLAVYVVLAMKLLVGLVVIIANMNWTGKTKLSQMNAIDLVGNFVLGGVVGGIIYNRDISFLTYIVCLLIGIALIDGFNYLVNRTNFFRSFAVGCPITLIADGKFCVAAINDKKNKIDLSIVASLLRSMGHFSFSGLEFLQIEPGGQLTVIEKKEGGPRPAFIVLMNGTIFSSLLESLEKDAAWLEAQLHHAGFTQLESIFMVEWWQDTLTVVCDNGAVKTIQALS